MKENQMSQAQPLDDQQLEDAAGGRKVGNLENDRVHPGHRRSADGKQNQNEPSAVRWFSLENQDQ